MKGRKDAEKEGDKMCKENDEKRNEIAINVAIDTTQAKREKIRVGCPNYGWTAKEWADPGSYNTEQYGIFFV